MPIYVYRCEQCGLQFEKRQSFSDQPLTQCESCHGRVHKVLQPTAIVFKGPGFYCTDHKSPSGASNGTNGHSSDSASTKGNGSSPENGAAAASSSTEKKDSTTSAAAASKA